MSIHATITKRKMFKKTNKIIEKALYVVDNN